MNIAGMPGIGGSLGECQVCGEMFLSEIIQGNSVQVGHIPGMNCDIAVHKKCAALLEGKPWDELPDGPLRRLFESADVEVIQ